MLLALAFTICVVRHSQEHGRLLLPPLYDDVVYLNDGWFWQNELSVHGPLGLVRQYLLHPPHSPYSSFVAAISYAFLGFEQSAPYYFSGIIVLGLLLFADFMLGHARLWQCLAVYAFALSVPYTAWSIKEFRPDLACGLATAIGLIWILRSPWLESSWKTPVLVGALWGLALLIKPTVFLLTTILFSGTIGLACLRDSWQQRAWPGWKTLARACLPAALGPTLLAGPHFLLAGGELWDYFYRNTLGAHRHLWEYRADRKEQLLYYLTSWGGKAMFGRHLWIILGLIALGMILLIASGRRRSEVRLLSWMLAVAFITWLLPTLNPVKSPFFAATFGFLVILAGLQVFCWLLQGVPVPRPPHNISRWVAGLVLVLALAFWRLPNDQLQRDSPLVVDVNQVVPAVYSAIRECRPSADSTILFTATGYVNRDVIRYLALRDDTSTLSFSDVAMCKEPAICRQEIDRATIIVAGEVGNGLTNNFPSSANQDRTLALVRELGAFVQVAAIPTHTGKHYFVFCKRSHLLQR